MVLMTTMIKSDFKFFFLGDQYFSLWNGCILSVFYSILIYFFSILKFHNEGCLGMSLFLFILLKT